MSILSRAAAALLATSALVAIASPSLAQDFKGKSAGDIVVRAGANKWHANVQVRRKSSAKRRESRKIQGDSG